MEFKQVIQTCLDFSIANDGTIQSYPAGMPNMLAVQLRKTRTEIVVCQTQLGVLEAEQTSNAVGEKNLVKEVVSTEEHLLKFLSRFWDNRCCTSDSGCC